MLFSFNNKKKQEPAGPEDAQDRMAASIVRHCIRWQSKWAAWMQHRAERFSGRGKVVVLSLFCLLAGGYSSFLAMSSSSGKPPPLARIEQKKDVHPHPPGGEISHAPVVITKDEYRKTQRFRQYLDSLDQTPSGEKLLDSLMANRPGLLDSVLLLENLYQSQIKNKP